MTRLAGIIKDYYLRSLPRLRAVTTPEALRAHLRDHARGYMEAVGGVAIATLVIALVRQVATISNISLLYLLAVLVISARRGRAPGLVASVLSFLAYDFFFIPPYYRLTVDDPSEWLSLGVLLVTAVVISQLTATVQARATEAIESKRQITVLYEFAEAIASTTDREELLHTLVGQVARVFRSDGLIACAIILPDALGWPIVHASAPEEHPALRAFDLQVRALAANASYVLRTGSSLAEPVEISTASTVQRGVSLYLPLRSGKRIVGVLGVVGTSGIRQFAAAGSELEPSPAKSVTGSDVAPFTQLAPQARLFLAFRNEIALALERQTLRQQAVHAEALRESDKLKNALLGTVTHDLRTPLASIKAAASSLLQPGINWSAADSRELLESIDQSADRLNRLVSNLLDLSRLEAGVAAPQKEWYALGDALAAVLDRLDLSGQSRDRAITLDLPEDLPLAPMDHEQIEQVLTNLIENALKYSPKETPIEAQARVSDDAQALEARVVDHGVGVPAGERSAIFDKFYRVQSVRLPWDQKRPPMGTGLGLAICASIIRAHGGRIWVESTPGGGATFIFTLPIHEAPPASAISTGASLGAATESHALPAAETEAAAREGLGHG